MNDNFVTTKNVKKFRAAAERIHHRLKGVERMALFFGPPGLGKSETAIHYAVNNPCIYIRMKKLMSARWFLMELVEELGASPKWRTKDLFDQCCELLQGARKTLILDEIDYFTQDSKVTETLRDLHDITHTPMILIGMASADKRLMRFPHLYDRFVEVYKFQPLDREDVEAMIKELSTVQFDEDAISKIANDSEGRIRKVIAFIHRAEHIAHGSRAKTICARDLK